MNQLSRIRISLLGLLLLLPLAAFSQGPRVQTAPDCEFGATFTSAGTSNAFDNREALCTSWSLVYTNTGFSAVGVNLQSTTDSGGAPNSGGWASTTPVSGSATLSSTAQQSATFLIWRPWLRINVGTLTGTGELRVRVFGWKNRDNSDANTGMPFVQIYGLDPGSSLQRVTVNSNGEQAVDTPFATRSYDGQASFSAFNSVTNPGAGQDLLNVNANGAKGLFFDAIEVATTSTSAILIQVDITSGVGSTCTAITPRNARMDAGTAMVNAVNHNCTTDPTFVATAYKFTVAANGTQILPLRGFLAAAATGRGLSIKTVGAVTGDVHLTFTMWEK